MPGNVRIFQRKWEQKWSMFPYLSHIQNTNQVIGICCCVVAFIPQMICNGLPTPPHLYCLPFAQKWTGWYSIMAMLWRILLKWHNFAAAGSNVNDTTLAEDKMQQNRNKAVCDECRAEWEMMPSCIPNRCFRFSSNNKILHYLQFDSRCPLHVASS